MHPQVDSKFLCGKDYSQHDFNHLVDVRKREVQCDHAAAADLVLKEVVLRCQRNGLAYAQVNTRFQNLLHDAIRQVDCITERGELDVQMPYVTDLLLREVARAQQVWGAEAKIVWFYDEIQASLRMIGTDPTLFAGVFDPILGSQVISGAQKSRVDYPCCNLFYGILVAIRKMLLVVSQGHVLLGNNLDLTPEVLDQNSPAQGCCVSYEEKFHLDEGAILTLLGTYLTDNAIAAADPSLVRQLCGRPLFISHFWTCLLTYAPKLNSTQNIDLGAVVNNALRSAYDSAIVDAKCRINHMWTVYSPTAHSATALRGLMALRYHSIVMDSGGEGVQEMHKELKEAIVRGILNCTGAENIVTLDNEPVTKNAFMLVGHERLLQKTDGVMKLLAARATMPMGSEACDFGEVLEACFPWYLVRECIIAKEPITLSRLLAPFLATHASCGQIVEQLEDYEVNIDGGCRWNAADSDRSPFSSLAMHPSYLIHHPDNNLAGPDVLHTVINRCDRQCTKPILYQLKNRQTGTISAAMASLNLGRMHPDRTGGIESAAHLSMRRVLEANQKWISPIRVLVTSKDFEPTVLHHVSWLNMHQWKHSPLILLTVNERNLGVDITQKADSAYGLPRDWHSVWPTDIKHSNLRTQIESIESSSIKVSLSIKITWNLMPFRKITKDMILTAVNNLTHGAEVTSAVKGRATQSLKITFAQITDAFKMVNKGKFLVGEKEMTCQFS
jgi:hypothetical protein